MITTVRSTTGTLIKVEVATPRTALDNSYVCERCNRPTKRVEADYHIVTEYWADYNFVCRGCLYKLFNIKPTDNEVYE